MLPDPVPVVVADRETSDSASDSVPIQDSALGSSIEMSREGSPAFEEIRHPDESSPGESPPAPSLNMSTSSTSGDNNPGPVAAAAAAIQSQEDEEEFVDETIIERIEALSEMFPKWIRSGVWSLTVNTKSSVKWCYSMGRTISWVVCSTAAVLVMPVLFEVERATVEEQQKQQQRQILLGPGAAMTGGGPPLMGPPPPIIK